MVHYTQSACTYGTGSCSCGSCRACWCWIGYITGCCNCCIAIWLFTSVGSSCLGWWMASPTNYPGVSCPTSGCTLPPSSNYTIKATLPCLCPFLGILSQRFISSFLGSCGLFLLTETVRWCNNVIHFYVGLCHLYWFSRDYVICFCLGLCHLFLLTETVS